MSYLRQMSPRSRSPRHLRPKRSLMQMLCVEVEQLEVRKREARTMRDRVLTEMQSTSDEMTVKSVTAEVVVSVTTLPASATVKKVVEVTETVVEIVEKEVLATIPEVVELSEPTETLAKPTAVAEVTVDELEQRTVMVEPSGMAHNEDLSSSGSDGGSFSECDSDSDHSSSAPALSSASTSPTDTRPSSPLGRSAGQSTDHLPLAITPLMLSSPLSMPVTFDAESTTQSKRRSNYWSKESAFWLCTADGCVTADKAGPCYGQQCEHSVCVWKEYSLPRESGLVVKSN